MWHCIILAAGILLSVTAAPARAQDTAPARNGVYLELLGHGVLYSLNYERLLLPRVRGRIGIAGYGSTPHPEEEPVRDLFVLAPLTVSYLHGRTHHLEMGGGGIVGYASDRAKRSGGGSGLLFLVAGLAGYRYQPPGDDLILRVAYTPFISQGTLHSWVGVAIGYGF